MHVTNYPPPSCNALIHVIYICDYLLPPPPPPTHPPTQLLEEGDSLEDDDFDIASEDSADENDQILSFRKSEMDHEEEEEDEAEEVRIKIHHERDR